MITRHAFVVTLLFCLDAAAEGVTSSGRSWTPRSSWLPLAQDRSTKGYYNVYPLKVDARIPNALDATVDTHVPVLPHYLPYYSKLTPKEYLKYYIKTHTVSSSSSSKGHGSKGGYGGSSSRGHRHGQTYGGGGGGGHHHHGGGSGSDGGHNQYKQSNHFKREVTGNSRLQQHILQAVPHHQGLRHQQPPEQGQGQKQQIEPQLQRQRPVRHLIPAQQRPSQQLQTHSRAQHQFQVQQRPPHLIQIHSRPLHEPQVQQRPHQQLPKHEQSRQQIKVALQSQPELLHQQQSANYRAHLLEEEQRLREQRLRHLQLRQELLSKVQELQVQEDQQRLREEVIAAQERALDEKQRELIFREETLQSKVFSEAESHTITKKSVDSSLDVGEKYHNLITDIFTGHEIVPEIVDSPPENLLELTFRTVRTFPGMTVTADVTRTNPLMSWPNDPDAYYTLILANLDINNRRNRTLSEYWHWLVANIPGDDVDSGEVVFDLLHPLVLADGDGDHRYGYFVLRQPGLLDYSSEGGPADNCSPNMARGRGPLRSVRDFMHQYDLTLAASTFLIVDHDKASDEIACHWQKCLRGQGSLFGDLTCDSGDL